MDLIERYAAAVLRRLPTARREAAEKELRDRLEQQRMKAGLSFDREADVEKVLREMGDPARMAEELRGDVRSLIGPGIYPLYEIVLKIVLSAVTAGLFIAMIVRYLMSGGARLLEAAGTLLSGLLSAFGAVTLVFFLIERYAPEADRSSRTSGFDPKDLPPVPADKDRMSRIEPAVSLVFVVIAMAAAIYAPRFVGFYERGGGQTELVPLFQADVYAYYLPYILLALALSLIGEILRLIVGRWTIRLCLLHLLLGIPSVVLAIAMFSDPGLFSSRFFSRLFQAVGTSDPMIFDLPLPSFLGRLLIGLAVFGFSADLITTMARAIRISLAKGDPIRLAGHLGSGRRRTG